MDHVLTKIKGSTGVITLNRSEVLNALSLEMVQAVSGTLTAWQNNNAIQQVIIHSACPKAFCAGGDLRYLYQHRNDKACLYNFFETEYPLNSLMHHYPKTLIGYLNGITMGGGVGMGMHGDFRIVTDDFVFAMPETTIGFFPDVGSSYLLRRCPGQTGMYLALTGNSINAADAYALGLVDAIISHKHYDEALESLVTHGSNETIRNFQIPASQSSLLSHRIEIDYCFGQNSIEKILEACQQSKNTFCQEAGKTLLTKSPTSLARTFEQQQLAKTMSFDQIMAQDLSLSKQFAKGKDFFEGIRAKIVDKTQDPSWE